ncbi:hypothetical protein GA0070614_1146 [Micromonospora coxensis]|uniref:Uncharacterized protein n=1 Tax=Micromonospora coxensis TaxID=356852 RepID=A0A1C5HD85_9ACTN|nr:hypothetical protein GA0070614_1146 [Micromonospora coxensis]
MVTDQVPTPPGPAVTAGPSAMGTTGPSAVPGPPSPRRSGAGPGAGRRSSRTGQPARPPGGREPAGRPAAPAVDERDGAGGAASGRDRDPAGRSPVPTAPGRTGHRGWWARAARGMRRRTPPALRRQSEVVHLPRAGHPPERPPAPGSGAPVSWARAGGVVRAGRTGSRPRRAGDRAAAHPTTTPIRARRRPGNHPAGPGRRPPRDPAVHPRWAGASSRPAPAAGPGGDARRTPRRPPLRPALVKMCGAAPQLGRGGSCWRLSAAIFIAQREFQIRTEWLWAAPHERQPGRRTQTQPGRRTSGPSVVPVAAAGR